MYRLFVGILGSIASLTFAVSALAVPVAVPYVDDPRCDAIPDQLLIDEIGLPSAGFPPGEALASVFVQPAPEICTGNGIALDDFEVTIVNLTPFDFEEVFFVADLGITVGNADGSVIGGGAIQDAHPRAQQRRDDRAVSARQTDGEQLKILGCVIRRMELFNAR